MTLNGDDAMTCAAKLYVRDVNKHSSITAQLCLATIETHSIVQCSLLEPVLSRLYTMYMHSTTNSTIVGNAFINFLTTKKTNDNITGLSRSHVSESYS